MNIREELLDYSYNSTLQQLEILSVVKIDDVIYKASSVIPRRRLIKMLDL